MPENAGSAARGPSPYGDMVHTIAANPTLLTSRIHISDISGVNVVTSTAKFASTAQLGDATVRSG